MFWWFQRGDDFLRCEAREVSMAAYELVVVRPDGTEHRERFTDEAALMNRQLALMRELENEGWIGPYGWSV